MTSPVRTKESDQSMAVSDAEKRPDQYALLREFLTCLGYPKLFCSLLLTCLLTVACEDESSRVFPTGVFHPTIQVETLYEYPITGTAIYGTKSVILVSETRDDQGKIRYYCFLAPSNSPERQYDCASPSELNGITIQ